MRKRPRVFAHRGGRKWAPENTLAAFRKSVEAGVDGIELDIQRASTGELVVFHDTDLARTTNGVGLVKDVSLAELRRLSAGAWFSPEFQDERIPLLAEVLDLMNDKMILNIEIKNAPFAYPGIDDDLLELLDGYRHRDNLIISSFDHRIIKSVHDKAPDLRIALLAECLFIDVGQYARQIGATVWHPCFDAIREEVVAEAQAAGLAINAWTVNSQREWHAAIQMGLDGIITDDPVGLTSYMERMAVAAG